MIVKPCAHPGCRRFAEPHTSRCTEHRSDYDRTVRAGSPTLAKAAKIRGSHRWQVCRSAFRATYPICCDPFNHHPLGPEPTAEIHHVTSLVSAPQAAFDWANLRPLCVKCHRAVEALERTGQPTHQLFTKPWPP